MIKKIRPSYLDKKYLELRPYIATPISVDFSKLIVNKPWGNEYLMFSNPTAEIWSLFIHNNKATSMHCHPNKKTALIVVEGKALFSTLNESMELFPMDTVIIESGTFHSTQGISKEGLRVLEFETPPMKHDLVRLEDKYGRTNEPYEGSEKMMTDNKSTIRFLNTSHGAKQQLGGIEMCIKKIYNRKDLETINDHNKFASAFILSGSILSKNHELLFSPGDMLTIDEFAQNGYECIFQNTEILSLKQT